MESIPSLAQTIGLTNAQLNCNQFNWLNWLNQLIRGCLQVESESESLNQCDSSIDTRIAVFLDQPAVNGLTLSSIPATLDFVNPLRCLISLQNFQLNIRLRQHFVPLLTVSQCEVLGEEVGTVQRIWRGRANSGSLPRYGRLENRDLYKAPMM